MKETKAWKINGFLGVIVLLILAGIIVWSIGTTEEANPFVIIPMALVIVILLASFTVVQPNDSKVIVFLGKYLGTIREDGFYVSVPAVRSKVSLRVRNFNSETLKVNDVDGNPIEIAAVVVYRVVDTAKALFDVEDYQAFVRIQSETALRHIATKYPYDAVDGTVISLRGNAEEVAHELAVELQTRLNVSGVNVIEARLTHLAYAPEIASAMLQRQQANAIVSARQKIVEGAVGMVESALHELELKKVVHFDEEAKAQMVSNLMIAIISEKGTQPVMNAGSNKK